MAAPAVDVVAGAELGEHPPSLAEHRWLHGRSGAWWLDPRTKAVVLLLVNLVAMNLDGSPTAWAARTLAMALVSALLISVGRVRFAVVMATSFAGGLIVLQAARYLPGAWALVGGLGTMLVQFLPIIAMAGYAIASTQVSELVASLERLRLPQGFVIPLSVVLRFLPTIRQEHRAIADAMRIRGIGGLGALRNPVTLLECRVVPLLMSLVRIGDELSAAALTRGLGGRWERTHICRVGFGWRDVVVLLAFVMPLAVMSQSWVGR